MQIMINDTKLIIENRMGEVVTIETYSQEKAEEMAIKITMEQLTK